MKEQEEEEEEDDDDDDDDDDEDEDEDEDDYQILEPKTTIKKDDKISKRKRIRDSNTLIFVLIIIVIISYIIWFS